MPCDMHHREAFIENEVTKYAKALGWRQRKMSFIGRRGCPDRWYFRQGADGSGQVLLIEFKDPNGKLSAAQKKEINWLSANGFDVHVIDSIEEGKAIFDERVIPPSEPHPDQIVRWPDGTEATWGEVSRGDYDWMSDDYEVLADTATPANLPEKE